MTVSLWQQIIFPLIYVTKYEVNCNIVFDILLSEMDNMFVFLVFIVNDFILVANIKHSVGRFGIVYEHFPPE